MNPSKTGYTTAKIKRIIRYLRPYLALEFGIALIMLIVVALALLDPLVLKIMIDSVLVDKNSSLLNILILALVGLFLLRGVLNILANYLIQFTGQRILFDIRYDLFQHLERLDLGWFSRTKTGEIMSRVNNDVERIQNILTSTMITIATDLVTLAAILCIIFLLDWRLSLISMCLFPPFFISQFYLGRKIKKRSRLARDKSAEILSFFQEAFTAIRLIQSFVREKFEARRLLRKSKDLINLRVRLGVLGALAASIAGFLSALGPISVLWYGGLQVIKGGLTIGGLVAFYAYVGRLFGPVFRLAQHNVDIQIAMASLDRILEYRDVESVIKDSPGCETLRGISGHVVFENVTFSYDHAEPVLENISFDIKPGQKVALVGRSGAGKSTVVNLLCRFYDPQAGTIFLDGHNLKKIRLQSLRNHIGLVSQETILFNSTIKENIQYGRPKASDAEIIEAARKAQIHDFIESLPRKYQTMAGDRGVRLSGGQCQRISIARTILKDPKIIIFDEAMSSLDSKSEILIQKALEPLLEGRTSIMIAHRLASVVEADNILVFDDHKLAERGKHDELLRKCGVYKMLWDRMAKDENQSQNAG
jgi:ABC-type multidrug transport system fused ATPase/permease subunit